jgi:hypothetical protein
MMQTVFAWILVGAVILAAYPWSAWLLARGTQSQDKWLTALVTLMMSIGALTLIMLWQGIASIPFSVWTISLPYFALMLPGINLWWRTQPEQKTASDVTENLIPEQVISRRYTALLLFIISIAILFNGAYWPFYRDDTIGIYHKYGKLIFESGALVPFIGRDDAFYQAYPMQMPLAYSYAYFASGWVNGYLAKTIATLLSVACLPAVYVLGRILYGSWAGWMSALLLAFAPTFARWASSGYVDLPMAFLYTLAAIFAWRLWKGGNWIDALLTGMAIGFAAWTKNAALMGIAFVSLWLVYAWFRGKTQFRYIILALSVCAVIAAPWYIRNWFEARLIVPPTAWTEQAERSLRTLLLLITQPQNFALTGWVIMLAIITAALDFIRRRLQAEPVMLAIWTLPFFGVWWLLVSYDPRFVLLFLPLLCVWGGGWLVRSWNWLPGVWQKRIKIPLALVALIWTLYIVWISVEFKGAILNDPFMNDASKHSIVLSGK